MSMAGLVDGGIGDNLNNVLRGIIPGLNTMDAPVHPVHSSGNRLLNTDDTVVINIPSGGGGDETENDNAGATTVPSMTEIRGLRSLLDRTFLFIILLCVKILIDHRLGLFVVIGLIGTFFHHNNNLKQQVIMKGKRQIWSLITMLLFLLLNIFFVYYIFSEQKLYRSLMFRQPIYDTMDLWTLLWVVGITDFMIKFMTIAIKTLFTILPKHCLTFKRRGKLFLMIEQLSQTYQTLTPIPVWILYLSSNKEIHWIINYGLVLLYIIFKAGALIDKLKELQAATRGICFDVQYGVNLPSGELSTKGQACPICQDEYTNPIQLQCKHIFCDECVSLWFDRERTCPMCRAKVAEDPAWKDGNTSLYLQLF